jgi:hypothetical protein
MRVAICPLGSENAMPLWRDVKRPAPAIGSIQKTLRRSAKWVLAAALAAFTLVQSASSAEIWFSPESHYPPAPGDDFLQLFNSPIAWGKSAHNIRVFKLSTQFFMAAPVSVVAQAYKTLNDNGMSLGIEAEVNCGRIPGTPEQAKAVVAKIRAAQGVLKYIALDEPVWHGHYEPGSAGCGISAAEEGNRAADIINVYINAFPNVVIGTIEPFPELLKRPDWERSITEFINQFTKNTGRPITFLHVDINWRDAHILQSAATEDVDQNKLDQLLAQTADFSKKSKIALGVILNGKSTAKTDAEWIGEAKAHTVAIDKSKIVFRDKIIQSWHRHPLLALPESSPDSFLSLVLWYTQTHPHG